MPVTLQDLLAPVTADDVEAQLLAALQGIGPVQHVGSGDADVVVAGAPENNYDGLIQIAVAGAPGTVQFNYSLDDGGTFAGPYAVASSGIYVAAGTGLTFTFGGDFVAGDVYRFQTIFPPFPVTDWEPGAIGRVLVKSESQSIANLAGSALPNVAGGGFVDYASSAGVPNDWLSLLSSELYLNDRYPPQTLLGQAQLTLASAASPQSVADGQLLAANSVGAGPNVLQYRNVGAFTINPGDVLSIPFQAESPGARYNIVNGALTVLKTPLPGLTITNPAPGTGAVSPSSGATGAVTVTGTPTGNFSVVLRVLSTGALGTATAQASLDGGTDFNAPFTLPGGGTYALPQADGTTPTGLTLHLSGTFTAADTYSFTSYASWILTAGRDVEGAQALQARDKARWTTLGIGGALSTTYDFLARNAPGGGSEVVKTYSAPDGTVGGLVNIVVAGPTGPVSSSALAAISGFIAARVPLGSKANVQNASLYSLAVTATVYVVAAQRDAANAAILLALSQLEASIPIAGEVDVAAIVDAIMNQRAAGVRNTHVTAPAVDTTLPNATVVRFSPITLNYVLV